MRKICDNILKIILLLSCNTAVWQQVSSQALTNVNSSLSFPEAFRGNSTFVMLRAKANQMRSYMNESADPCNNFYQFACGNWPTINPANERILSTGIFENLYRAHQSNALMWLLKNSSESNSSSTSEVDMKVKQFFMSCMLLRGENATTRQQKFVATIEEFGQMPALKPWSEKQREEFDWLTTVARITYKYDKNILLALEMMQDIHNKTINRLYINHAPLSLGNKAMYFENNTAIYRESYERIVTSNLMLHLGLSEQQARQAARDVLEFENKLAEGLVDETLGLTIAQKTRLMSVDEMQQKYAPTIDIKKYLKTAFGEIPEENIYDFSGKFKRNLISVLQITAKEQVANYIFYKLLESFIFEPTDQLDKQTDLCYAKTKQHFVKYLENILYREYNATHMENEIKVMWQAIKELFGANLGTYKLNWLTAETRKLALEKLQNMRLEVGSYLEENFTETYAALSINQTDYLANLKSMLQLNAASKRNDYKEPPKLYDVSKMVSFSPANIIIENVVQMPVSILQPFYFISDVYPNALKYGTLGFLVGHEMIHGFDDNGRHYDKYGNSKNWWDDDSTEQFNERTKCFTEQYHKYYYHDHFLPKSKKQSENIADNAGIQLAYDAYIEWYMEAARAGQNLQVELMPNMNYTSEQMFFISFAQIWCNDVNPPLRVLQTSTDDHTPGEFRVIGALSNFDAFAEAFECKLNTPMNPQEKCELY